MVGTDITVTVTVARALFPASSHNCTVVDPLLQPTRVVVPSTVGLRVERPVQVSASTVGSAMRIVGGMFRRVQLACITVVWPTAIFSGDALIQSFADTDVGVGVGVGVGVYVGVGVRLGGGCVG